MTVKQGSLTEMTLKIAEDLQKSESEPSGDEADDAENNEEEAP